MNNIKNIFIILIWVINIAAGFILMLMLTNLQGFPIGILLCGSLIVLNFSRFSHTFYNRLIYSSVIPLIALFSLTIIMTLIDKNLPAVYRTSIPVGLIILFFAWGVVFANLFISRFICEKGHSKGNFIFSDIIGTSFVILGIVNIGFGFFTLPLSASSYAKGLPVSFWISVVIIFSGLLKMRIMKHIFTQNLQNISVILFLSGLLDAFIWYIFSKHISKIIISTYLIIFFAIPALYFFSINRNKKV